ncbi:MAG TPA: MMPL family transporter [Thermoanaerobaculia bacterium]
MTHPDDADCPPSARSPWSPWVARVVFWLLVAAMGGSLWVVLRIDLTPRVESDFFFSTGDPAFQATELIGELFPSRPQLIVNALAPDVWSGDALDRVRRLSDELAALPGVAAVQSLTHGPPTPAVVPESPVWSRLLLSEDPNATQMIVTLEEGESRELVARVEQVLAAHDRPSFDLEVSGVPYVIELIRRYLMRDLKVFSSAALLVFGLVIAILYRSLPLVAGTLLSCVGACLLTLTALHLAGTPIGMLTANIATIVFVLTLSHTVFLTANWRRVRPGLSPEKALATALWITFAASFWCMVAALLGFGSLLLASARPLRELGVSGVVGTVAAIVVAYGFYPVFLRAARSAPPALWSRPDARHRLPGPLASVVIAVLCAAAAFGLPRTETDPSLLAYFAAGSELRHGLETIDRHGGSSPLYLVVSDPGKRRVDSPEVEPRLERLQRRLENDPAVGMALSLSVLLEEARRAPFAVLFGTAQLVDLLAGERFDQVARGFVTDDRVLALYFLRMHETGREEEREAIVARLVAAAREAGLEPELVGGLYDLQGKLGELVASSLARELGGLLAFFVLVAAAVARAARPAAAMVLCLAAVPVLLLGAMGYLGQPVDVIAAPGANVAISLGIDGMIHLVMAVRRRRRAGDGEREAWGEACRQMRQPIVGAMLILAAGFGIFVLSSFPPTQRFGSIVAAGTLISAAMALLVLPYLAAAGRGARDAPAAR